MPPRTAATVTPHVDAVRPLRILWLSKVAPEHRAPRIWQVAKRLVALGHDVRVLAARTEPDLPDQRVLDGVCLRYVATAPRRLMRHPRLGFYASRLPWYLVAARAAERWLRTDPVDVVVEDLSPVGAVAVDRTVRKLGIPLVQDVHYLLGGPSAWLRMYGPIGLWGATYERLLVRGLVTPAALVSDSRPLLERVQRLRPDLATTWIPNGIDLERGGEPRIADGPIHLLAVGRLAQPKGHRVLIDAMALLRDRPDVTLTIVGDGPLAATLAGQIRELGLEGSVALAGRIPWEELHHTYRAADIFVMPSLAEGLPIALVEALGSGAAVIASDIPEHRQVAGDEAIAWARVGDPMALADAIRALADDPRRRASLAAAARQTVERQFTWDIVTAQWQDLLVRLASPARAAA
jgi:glycosyltransferase involved in cell wall biosynthesis